MTAPYIADSTQDETPSRLPDWRELLAILMERAWIGLAVALAVFGLFFIQLKRTTPYYRSTAVLLVEAQTPRLLDYQDVVAMNFRNLEYFNTVINTLHSRQMMEQAIRQSGLADRQDFFPGVTGVVQKAAAAGRLVKIAPVEKSRLINVTVEHPDPRVASDLANAMARSYIQQELDDRMKASMQAVDWLKDRSAEYREKLDRGMLELQEYREKTESVSLEEDQNIVIAKLKALNGTLTSAQTERIDAETQWKAIQSQIDGGAPMLRVAAQLTDEGVSVALSNLKSQQQRLAQLRQRYKQDHPDVKEAVELERSLQSTFEESCEVAVYALKRRYETLKEREANLLEALKEQEQQAFALARALVRYNDLKRNVEADQEIYQSMISRMKEASVSGTIPAEIIRLAEEARPAGAPFRPQPQRVLVRGAVFGLVLGVGIIFLLYYTDHRFRRNEEVERALGVPVLASLPFIPGKTVHERGMVAHLQQSGEVAEAFRNLRAFMQIHPDIRKARVLVVTSALPGEGKSLVSANLAISFAHDNRRTLLVGADLRRPVFHRIFDAGDMPVGLSQVLKGELEWQQAIRPGLVPNLDVLPSGAVVSHPSELLGGKRMSDLMAEARDGYERIIIDSSPMLGISDALILMRHTDGVLFVVRCGVTHSLGATHAVRRIADSGTPCLGAVMNGVNLSSLSNYYYYRRYGGYAYRQYQAQAEPSSET